MRCLIDSCISGLFIFALSYAFVVHEVIEAILLYVLKRARQ